jgi:hypothetical protein
MAELDLFTADECDRIAETVLGLRDLWTVRSPNAAFFTLGVNAYMDLAPAADPDGSYYRPAGSANPLLTDRFADVHRRLAAGLGEALGLPARYPQSLALPGFHIWTGAGIPRRGTASVHFDLQYQRIVTRPEFATATGTVSYTLPVRLPAAGSSLNVWPEFTYPDDAMRVAQARATPPTVVGYHVGRALVHSGHVLHQIGPTPSVAADDVRITLQGHGIVVDDELILYW